MGVALVLGGEIGFVDGGSHALNVFFQGAQAGFAFFAFLRDERFNFVQRARGGFGLVRRRRVLRGRGGWRRRRRRWLAGALSELETKFICETHADPRTRI